jgi:rhodanese-related sulfurtransferase
MRIPEAPLHDHGYFEARPGDVAVRDDLLLVDVRDERELLDAYGHVHGVLLCPMDALLEGGLGPELRDRPLVLICDNGFRSRKCARHLVEAGHPEVYLLVGGMRRWTAEERPVARVPTWVTAAGPRAEDPQPGESG